VGAGPATYSKFFNLLKGIVSRDFVGLQMILMAKAQVTSMSAACLFFHKFTFSNRTFKNTVQSVLSFAATKQEISVTTGIFYT